MLCSGSTPAHVPGYTYHHQCKLDRDHDGECLCVGCNKTFKPDPPLPPRVPVESGHATLVRVVPPEEIDPARSLLAKDYMRGMGPKDLKRKP